MISNLKKHTYIVGLGSNVVDRVQAIGRSIEWLRSLVEITINDISDIYTTQAVDGAVGTYSNAVVSIGSDLDLDALSRVFKDYETANGRVAGESSPRKVVSIDLDIVIADNAILRPHELDRDYFTIGYNQITCKLAAESLIL